MEDIEVITKTDTSIRVTVDCTPLRVEFTGTLEIERLPSGQVTGLKITIATILCRIAALKLVSRKGITE
jgi:hypothetical protein